MTDLVQASAWACLAIFAACAVEPSVSERHAIEPDRWLLVWAIASYGAGFIFLINGIHGGLRDLENDRACGANTTAIWLGAQVDPETGEAISNTRIALFAFAVHLAMFVMPTQVLLSKLVPSESRDRVMLALYGLGSISLLVLWFVVKPRQPRRDHWIGWHLLVLLLPAAAAFIPFLDLAATIILLTAFFVPLLVQQTVVFRVLRWIHPTIAEDAICPPGTRHGYGPGGVS